MTVTTTLRSTALAMAVAAGATGATLAATPPPQLPVAEVRDVPTTLQGVTVHDPYRWLEDVKSPQTQAWLQGQGAGARSVLDRIDGREAIAKRLAELSDAQGDAVRSVVQMPGPMPGGRIYYLKRRPGDKQFKLMLRNGVDGAEQLLVDPERLAQATSVPHAINYFMPSWDGRHVAYGVSAGGSEDASLVVLDVAAGKPIGEPVPRVHGTPLHWLPDSRSLTFTQLALLPAGAMPTERYKDSRVLWLRVGAPAASAKAVFGATVTPKLGLDRLDVGELITVPGSPWAVVRTTDTTVPRGKLFVAPLARLGQPGLVWQRIAGPADNIVRVALRGNHLVLMTQAGAPRRKIVALDLRRPLLASAQVLAAQPADGVLEEFALTPSGLVAQVRQGASVSLRRYGGGATAGRALPAPAAGATVLAGNPAHDSESLLYLFSAWTEPLRWYRLDGDRSSAIALGQRAVPPGLPAVEVTDVLVQSHDGVRVPMTILHRQGLALDGRNPVLLNGYGAYGRSTSAFFSADNMVWIERGGVLAFINPRGSGAFGDDWHRAGFKTTKSNTWKDGIAGAKYLIARGYGSPATMGIQGGSAGGIFAGRASTEAPELFAAAIYNVGLLDTIRAEESANGATNVSEFGSVKDPAEFKALLEMSTYANIVDGTAYPGVLLVHGMNDPRVDVWQSGKAAARLQAANPNGKPALLRLDMQAGHGVGNTLTQQQAMTVDVQSFLLWQMGKAGLRD